MGEDRRAWLLVVVDCVGIGQVARRAAGAGEAQGDLEVFRGGQVRREAADRLQRLPWGREVAAVAIGPVQLPLGQLVVARVPAPGEGVRVGVVAAHGLLGQPAHRKRHRLAPVGGEVGGDQLRRGDHVVVEEEAAGALLPPRSRRSGPWPGRRSRAAVAAARRERRSPRPSPPCRRSSRRRRRSSRRSRGPPSARRASRGSGAAARCGCSWR